MHIPARRLVPFAAAAALSGALVGCQAASGSGIDAITPTAAAARYGYSISSASLTPVFALVPEYRNPQDGYARDLLAKKCLQGIVEYRAAVPNSNTDLFDERTGQLAFNEEIAMQSGYPHLRPPTFEDSAVPDDVEVTPVILDQMVKCGEQADERLGGVPDRLLNDIQTAGWDAAKTSAEVRQAVEAWRTCMAPAGVIDLPDDPEEMPTPSVFSAPGTTDAQGMQIDAAPSVLSEREREVAVYDAQCQAEADYPGAVFRARAEAELAAIGRDLEGFESSRIAYEEYGKKIDAVITELG